MNKLFLTAITGECCLLQLHNIRQRSYNPFVLLCQELKKEDVKVSPKDRAKCLLYLRQIYKDNNIKQHALLNQAINSLKKIESHA